MRPNDFCKGLETFVISLGPIPRNDKLQEQLISQGLNAHLVNAFDGRLWAYPYKSVPVNVERFEKITGRRPSGPEIGCALSHRECARQAQTKDASYALVLEEDADISTDLFSALTMFRRLDSRRPKVLQLYLPQGSILRKNSVIKLGADTGDIASRFFTPPPCTVGYLMNRAAIDLFSSKETVEGVADWPPFAYAVEFWGYVPCPVTHMPGGSTLDSARAAEVTDRNYRHKFIKMLFDYFALFQFKRVVEHSRSLGSLKAYIQLVIAPHTSKLLRYAFTETLVIGSKSYKFR